MEFGSGSEGIDTKSLSQSLSERAPALDHALERAKALERALDLMYWHLAWRWESTFFVLSRALTYERAVAVELARGLQPMVTVPQNQSFDLAAVLADSGIMEIINSIEPDDRYKLASFLWLHSPQTKHEYLWLCTYHPPSARVAPTNSHHRLR